MNALGFCIKVEQIKEEMAILSINNNTTVEEMLKEEQKRNEEDIAYIAGVCERYDIRTWNDMSTIISLVDKFRELNSKGVMFPNDR